jgi:hypothetical protein
MDVRGVGIWTKDDVRHSVLKWEAIELLGSVVCVLGARKNIPQAQVDVK